MAKPKLTAKKALRANLETAIRTYCTRAAGMRQLAQEQEMLLDEIIAAGYKPGEQVKLSDGTIVTLVDNYAYRNVTWRACCVRRYEIKQVKQTTKRV